MSVNEYCDSKWLNEIYYMIYIRLRDALPPGKLVIRVNLPQKQWTKLYESHPDLKSEITRGLESFVHAQLGNSQHEYSQDNYVTISACDVQRTVVTIECIDDCVRRLIGTTEKDNYGAFAIKRSDDRGCNWIKANGIPHRPDEKIAILPVEQLCQALESLTKLSSNDSSLWNDGEECIIAGFHVMYFRDS